MVDVLKALLEVVPNWVTIGIGIAILLLTIGLVVLIFNSTKRTLESAHKESDIRQLESDIRILNTEKDQLENQVACLEGAVKSTNNFAQAFVKSVGKNLSEFEYDSLTQRIIESICNDIKMTSKTIHRSALWIYTEENNGEQILTLHQASSGFEVRDLNLKKLNIHNSVAGRCFRTKKKQIVNNVSEDPDWNFKENRKYEAILCFPIGDYGVITIDSKETISEQIVGIVALYSTLVEGIFDERMRNFNG